MTCAYSAGALEAIHDHYKFRHPHVLIGASGSAGSCAYFVAGQSKVGRQIWCDLLTDGQMISYRKRPILNIDYLVNTVFKKTVPLDHEAVRHSQIQFLIPVINTETGLIRYVSNELDEEADVFKTLIAAKTVPVVAGGPQYIDDMKRHRYIDGDIAQQLNQHTRLAKQYGCDQIVVIDNETDYGLSMKLLLWIYYFFAGAGIRRAIKRGLRDHGRDIQDDERIVTLRPQQPLKMPGLSDKKERVERAYTMGYQDAVNHPRLKALLQS